MLSQCYGVVADAAVSVDGRVVKFMGDAALLTFPFQRTRDAVEVLRGLQKTASELWRRFDEGCCIWVRIGVGPVVCGHLGAPGEEQFDVVGDSLNQLFKAPSGDFQMTPGVIALLS